MKIVLNYKLLWLSTKGYIKSQFVHYSGDVWFEREWEKRREIENEVTFQYLVGEKIEGKKICRKVRKNKARNFSKILTKHTEMPMGNKRGEHNINRVTYMELYKRLKKREACIYPNRSKTNIAGGS